MLIVYNDNSQSFTQIKLTTLNGRDVNKLKRS